jgi:hypothetical protein
MQWPYNKAPAKFDQMRLGAVARDQLQLGALNPQAVVQGQVTQVIRLSPGHQPKI